MTAFAPVAGSNRRVWVYLAATFAITWGAWWGLVWIARAGVSAFGEPLFMSLYMLGGFGPTIAAYLAVLATRDEGTLAEFHSRLLRWRVAGRYWSMALVFPFLLAGGLVLGAIWWEPGVRAEIDLKPWWMVFPLLAGMVVGGGLEELGWRGVAQPALDRRLGSWPAVFVVGTIWALWHLPLFSLPGTGQFGAPFLPYFVWVLGLAALLAWLYRRTGSILLCVVFHAAVNAALALGLTIRDERVGLKLAAGVVVLGVGLAFLAFDRQPAASSQSA